MYLCVDDSKPVLCSNTYPAAIPATSALDHRNQLDEPAAFSLALRLLKVKMLQSEEACLVKVRELTLHWLAWLILSSRSQGIPPEEGGQAWRLYRNR